MHLRTYMRVYMYICHTAMHVCVCIMCAYKTFLYICTAGTGVDFTMVRHSFDLVVFLFDTLPFVLYLLFVKVCHSWDCFDLLFIMYFTWELIYLPDVASLLPYDTA